MKTFLQKALLIILILPVISCGKPIANLDTRIDFRVVNAQGQNLLNTPGGYNKNNINLYYVIYGHTRLYSQPKLDADKGFMINDSTITVYLNHLRYEKTSLTLIKFGDSKTDTIEAKFKFTGNYSTHLEKVWYNGKRQDPPYKIFTVIK